MVKETENRAKEDADKRRKKFFHLLFSVAQQIMLLKRLSQLLTCQMTK